MSKIDLNPDISLRRSESCRGMVHEQWPHDFCSTDGPASARRVSPLRGPLRRRLQGAEFLLPRSILVFGFCPTHISRESARHRNLPARASAPTLPHGPSGRHLAQQSRQRQPAPRLAHLRRFCPRGHRAGPRPLSARPVRGGIGADSLRVRFHHRRFVLVALSLGAVSPAQECGETPHLARSARQHSDRGLCDRRAGERCETARSTGTGSRGVLSPRPGLRGLSAPLPDHPSPGFLRHARRAQHALPSLRVARGRSLHRPAFRSDHSPHWTQELASLPRTPAAHSLLRRQERLAPHLPHQQLSTRGADYRRTLPCPLASRIVLSLDQTTSAYPRFLRHLGECREDPSVGGDQRLRAGGHLEKATPTGPELVQNPANSECHNFRKKPDFTGFFAIQRPNPRTRPLYPTGSVQHMMGQYCLLIHKSGGNSPNESRTLVLPNYESPTQPSTISGLRVIFSGNAGSRTDLETRDYEVNFNNAFQVALDWIMLTSHRKSFVGAGTSSKRA